MPTTPAITARVSISVLDINGNKVYKAFNAVSSLTFDYVKGMVNIVDLVQGSFYFSLAAITTHTHTIVGGVGGVTTVVMT